MTNATYPSPLREFLLSTMQALGGAIAWAFSRFMRAPTQNLAISGVALAIILSASNALFWQKSPHPSPFFSDSMPQESARIVGEIRPELNAPHPLELAVARASSPNTTQSVGNLEQPPIPAPVHKSASATPGEVTHEDLLKVQQALSFMGFFDQKVDGYYGPLTAKAIRAFETYKGLPPKGAVTPQIVAIILGEPLTPVVAPMAQQGQSAQSNIAPVTPTNEQANNPQQALPALLQPASRAGSAANVAQTIALTPPVEVASAPVNPLIDSVLIEKIQRGLSSLGFYYSTFDGIAGESTARAIREFENFKNIEQTGMVSSDLLDLLVAAGARID